MEQQLLVLIVVTTSHLMTMKIVTRISVVVIATERARPPTAARKVVRVAAPVLLPVLAQAVVTTRTLVI